MIDGKHLRIREIEQVSRTGPAHELSEEPTKELLVPRIGTGVPDIRHFHLFDVPHLNSVVQFLCLFHLNPPVLVSETTVAEGHLRCCAEIAQGLITIAHHFAILAMAPPSAPSPVARTHSEPLPKSPAEHRRS